jgi:hypothetical protein
MYYNVKVRDPKAKTFSFLTPKYGKTRLKIHALMVDGEVRAKELADEIMKLNKGVMAKIQKVL